jgi:hypothetical protein
MEGKVKQYLIVYWLEQNNLRRGSVGPWAGAHTKLVQAKSMRDALEEFAHPADIDCYKLEIFPVHHQEGGDK